MLTTSLQVIGFSLFVGVLSEVACHFMIYRDSEYKKVKAQLLRSFGDWEKAEAQKDKAARRAPRLLKEMQSIKQKLAMMKMRGTVLFGFITMGLLYLVNRYFHGRVAAKLPFEPLSFLTGVTHRGLEGDDLTDCSTTFLYVLCSMCIRPYVQKLFGESLPREIEAAAGTMATLGQAMDQMDKQAGQKRG